MSTIYIVEEERSIREETLGLLIGAGYRCEAYDSPQEFLGHFDPQRPGCVLVDLKLPDVRGESLLEILSHIHFPPPVIAIGDHGDIKNAVRAIKGGAVDFLEKPICHEKLLDRVREALAVDTQRCKRRIEHMSMTTRLASLTPREREVMEGLVAGETADQIGARFGLSTKTIYTHRSHVLVKAGVDSIASLTRMAMQAYPGPRIPSNPVATNGDHSPAVRVPLAMAVAI